MEKIIDLYKYHINENADESEIESFKILFSLNNLGPTTSDNFQKKFIDQQISIKNAERWIMENSKKQKLFKKTQAESNEQARIFSDINFFLRDPLSDITPEDWEAAKPKILNPNLKMPIIFGTGGEIHSGKDFSEMWNNPESYSFDKVFTPANTGHWNDPVEPLNYGEAISKEDLENIVGMIRSKSRRVGFTHDLEQLKTQIESDIWLRDFHQAKRGSNYTKPKNRKKKNR